mgnify:CR=1 FL=1
MSTQETDIPVLKTVKVKLKNGPDFLTYYFHDGNIGGMLVPGRSDLQLGSTINIELYTLEENKVFSIRGQVKWRRLRDEAKLRAGAGIEFLDSERKARDTLLEFANGRAIAIHRRKSARLPAIIEVDYAAGSVFLTDVTDNVSKGGAFLLTRSPPPLGTIFSSQRLSAHLAQQQTDFFGRQLGKGLVNGFETAFHLGNVNQHLEGLFLLVLT